MIGVAFALLAAYGTFLLYTAVAFGWTGPGLGPTVVTRRRRRNRVSEFLNQAGLSEIRPVELAGVMVALAVVGGGVAYAIFGGLWISLVMGVITAGIPVASARSRRERRRVQAKEAWPRMLEEIRLQATTMGRSLPQSLLSVGLAGPVELRPAFEAAQREWNISTDFSRTLDVLKGRLADATADSVCETLLISHEVGGSDLDRRLSALAEDRMQDLQSRKDARAKQAGARFARWFVIIVPFGMALAGLSIGEGRPAYGTALGQTAVLVGLVMMAGCWVWAARIMRMPTEERVFDR